MARDAAGPFSLLGEADHGKGRGQWVGAGVGGSVALVEWAGRRRRAGFGGVGVGADG